MSSVAAVIDRDAPTFDRQVPRHSLGGREGGLTFAQVREDPLIEIEALAVGPTKRVVVIGSGGCTALSLLAAGAGAVVAVDANASQNHLIELKAAAICALGATQSIAFLGAAPMQPSARLALYSRLRARLSPSARAYWDRRRGSLTRGALDAGKSERFIRLIAWTVRGLVHNPRRVQRLLACRTIAEQRELFAREWDTRRWRSLFALLLNRWTMSRAYDASFFTHVGRRDFADHFRRLVEHALTELPVRDNYFLHQMLTGRYPADVQNGVPPYLSEVGAARIAERASSLTLIDGGIIEYLRTLPARSVDGIALSNVCEWMDDAAIDALFREVVRVIVPGGRVVFRNFVGWTELPASAATLVPQEALGARLTAADRSLVQSRVVVCIASERHTRPATTTGIRKAVRTREATPADNTALVELSRRCVMHGDLSMCIDRAPDFFALNRLEGDAWVVGVATNACDDVIGCIAISRRTVWINGERRCVAYVSDLKVDPSARGSGAADLLTWFAAERIKELCGVDALILSTVLAGNSAMEHRNRGPRGLSPNVRFATINVLSIPLLWKRETRLTGWSVRQAGAADIPAMAEHWRELMSSRQLATAMTDVDWNDWLSRAPGLSVSDYLLAFDARGQLDGFVGAWDQSEFKRLRITSYSRRLAIAKRAINVVAPVIGARALPRVGEPLPALALVHVCARSASGLRALLAEAYHRYRGRYAFMTLGLDARDPLLDGMRGLFAQPTKVHAYVTSLNGEQHAESLGRRPLSFETALV